MRHGRGRKGSGWREKVLSRLSATLLYDAATSIVVLALDTSGYNVRAVAVKDVALATS